MMMRGIIDRPSRRPRKDKQLRCGTSKRSSGSMKRCGRGCLGVLLRLRLDRRRLEVVRLRNSRKVEGRGRVVEMGEIIGIRGIHLRRRLLRRESRDIFMTLGRVRNRALVMYRGMRGNKRVNSRRDWNFGILEAQREIGEEVLNSRPEVREVNLCES